MRPRIELLPDSVINQIAAGEVVERPASVVKELVENSIDAGARHIEVECELGGTRLIRVHDNGTGIPRDELRLALSRHATSKLRAAAELASIATLGFRGEALPSIGSIARLTVTSCTEPEAGAWSVSMHGSADIDGPQPAAHNRGTTTEVRDLFFSVPARRRFLKSERTEFLHIHDWLRRTALASPHIDLRLVHNSQRVLALRPALSDAEQAQRVGKICGAAFARTALPVHDSAGDLGIRGWIAPAAAARNQSDLQFWFVNGRPVRDPRLQHAARLGYEDALVPGRHAAYVLYLQVSSAQVDVNVHPAKTEVRFADTRRVHDFVFSALRRTLRGPQAVAVPEQDHAQSRMPEGRGHVNEQQSSYGSAVPPPPRTPVPGRQSVPSSGAGTGWAGEALTVLSNGMTVTRSGDALMLIASGSVMHALFMRALRMQAAAGVTPKQPLMFPLVLDVTVAEREVIDARREFLEACGLDIDVAGPSNAMVRAIPAALSRAPADSLAATALALMSRTNTADREDVWSTLCSDAARALCPRQPAEMALLLREIEAAFDYETLAQQGLTRRLDLEALSELLRPVIRRDDA